MIIAFFIAAILLWQPFPVQQSEAVIYLYRVEESPASRKTEIKLNGKPLLTIKEGYFVGVRVPAGRHELQIFDREETAILLNAQAGQRYFVKVSQVDILAGYTRTLTKVEEEQAVFQMRNLKPLDGKKNVKDKSVLLVLDLPK
jgi:hypothetical protein